MQSSTWSNIIFHYVEGREGGGGGGLTADVTADSESEPTVNNLLVIPSAQLSSEIFQVMLLLLDLKQHHQVTSIIDKVDANLDLLEKKWEKRIKQMETITAAGGDGGNSHHSGSRTSWQHHQAITYSPGNNKMPNTS